MRRKPGEQRERTENQIEKARTRKATQRRRMPIAQSCVFAAGVDSLRMPIDSLIAV
jgi:hypothetical protein